MLHQPPGNRNLDSIGSEYVHEVYTWDLIISDFPLSWIEKHLDPLVTKQLKCWSGLALPADPSRLFLPSSVGGLELPSISFLYQKLQVCRAALVTTTRDPTIQHSFHLQVQKEKKSSASEIQACMCSPEGYFWKILEPPENLLSEKSGSWHNI